MKVLVVGSGGREHALVWKISQSPKVKKIYCAPGNAGISNFAECVDIRTDDLDSLVNFAKENFVDLTIIGPEIPLCRGIVDLFNDENLQIFGPDKAAARLEASKVFAKEIMTKFGIPTAGYKVFKDNQNNQAIEYIESLGRYPAVVKADGLAAGKGVIIAKDKHEAKKAINNILVDKIFGTSGNRVVIEECLEGEEASILTVCDGDNFLILPTSQDHKRIFDNDQGPNTGGMGAYSPVPMVREEILEQIKANIIKLLLEGMKKEGIPYKGVLYVGLMITKTGPKVLEFNVRFGDPETQAVLPRLRSDLVDIMLASIEGRLKNIELEIRQDACVSVVMASAGYPGKYDKGKEISGLDSLKDISDVFVFHAGTKKDNGKVVTNGGRVLGVTGLGNTIKAAIDKTYQSVKKIKFEGAHFRKDIGARAIWEDL